MKSLLLLLIAISVNANEIDSPNYQLLSSIEIKEISEICLIENDNGEMQFFKGECTQAKLNLELGDI